MIADKTDFSHVTVTQKTKWSQKDDFVSDVKEKYNLGSCWARFVSVSTGFKQKWTNSSNETAFKNTLQIIKKKKQVLRFPLEKRWCNYETQRTTIFSKPPLFWLFIYHSSSILIFQKYSDCLICTSQPFVGFPSDNRCFVTSLLSEYKGSLLNGSSQNEELSSADFQAQF